MTALLKSIKKRKNDKEKNCSTKMVNREIGGIGRGNCIFFSRKGVKGPGGRKYGARG